MKKYIVIIMLVFIIVIVTALPVFASVKTPRVSVSYSDQTPESVDVDVTLAWDDYGNGTSYYVEWTDSMLGDGSGLDYKNRSTEGSIISSGSKKTFTTKLSLYKNYYFRVTNVNGPEQASANVRVFPVKTGPGRNTNEYVHGNYTDNTAMCGYCHNTHASLKEQLIQEATYYKMCTLCHGTASTQSKYNVEDGTVRVDGGIQPSLAGPFVSGMTSRHDADDSALEDAIGKPKWEPEIVPGSDPSKPLSLTCISCHDVHSGPDDNYRLLRKTIYADDARTEDLKTVDIDVDAYAITPDGVSGEELYMVKGNTEFCSSCHLDYDDGSGRMVGKDPRLTTSEAVYRHPTSVAGRVYSVYGADGLGLRAPSLWGPLPLQYNADERKADLEDLRTAVVCSTCHYAHGTTKKFDTNTGANKYLLRLDNYGTCESCHKK